MSAGNTARVRHAFMVALAATQLVLCYGSVYLKENLSKGGGTPNAVVFALYRECGAGILLIIGSSVYYRVAPQRNDVWLLFGMGLGLFFNQLLYLLGLKMAGVLIATCMQPSIPIFTVALAMLFSQEKSSYQKVAGILLAAFGSAAMVYGTSRGTGSSAVPLSQSSNPFLGSLCLVGNCFAMSCYFILSRRVASKYPPVCLTAWAYGTAAMWMSVVAAFTVERSEWQLPSNSVGPLLYWIFVSSIISYCIMTCSTRYLPASQVSAFICLQPLFGSLMAVALLGESVDAWDLGGLGVLAGLGCVLHDQHSHQHAHHHHQHAGPSRASTRSGYGAIPADDRSAVLLSFPGRESVSSFQGSSYHGSTGSLEIESSRKGSLAKFLMMEHASNPGHETSTSGAAVSTRAGAVAKAE